jgi:hypothetical protein
MNLASDDAEEQARVAGFHQGPQQLGWTVGRNVQIDYRWGAGNADHIRKFAAELVALAPDVKKGLLWCEMASSSFGRSRTGCGGLQHAQGQRRGMWLGR